jgi:tetratricopeptide (TPR) repeat protein
MYLGKLDDGKKEFDTGLSLSRSSGLKDIEGKFLLSLGELSWQRSNYQEAIDFCKSSLQLCEELNDLISQSKLCGIIGDTYFSQGLFNQAVDFYNRSLDLALDSEFKIGEGESLRRLGSVYGCRGQAEMALRYLTKALEIARETGNRQSEWLVLMVMGNIHIEQDNFETAANCYIKAQSIAHSIGRRRGESRIAVNLAELCKRQGNLQDARRYLNEAYTIAVEIQDHEIEGHTLSNLGSVYLESGEYDSSYNCFQQALKIFSDKYYHSNVEVEALSGIARIFWHQDKINHAKRYFRKAINKGKKLGLWQLSIQNLRSLAACEHKIGETKAARRLLDETLSLIGKKLAINAVGAELQHYQKLRSEILKDLFALELST